VREAFRTTVGDVAVTFLRIFSRRRLNRLSRSDNTGCLEAKQSDDGIGDTFALVGADFSATSEPDRARSAVPALRQSR
jgi:hypothetical protein